jgi:hypothetical protein
MRVAQWLMTRPGPRRHNSPVPAGNGEVERFDRIGLQSRAGRGTGAYAGTADLDGPGRRGHCSGSRHIIEHGLSTLCEVEPWFDAARSREVLSGRSVGPLQGRCRGLPARVSPPALRPS